jgi:hypothetical protein
MLATSVTLEATGKDLGSWSGIPGVWSLSDAGPVTAHSAIKAEHATTSSAESETYSHGPALFKFANDLLALSYVVEEALALNGRTGFPTSGQQLFRWTTPLQ